MTGDLNSYQNGWADIERPSTFGPLRDQKHREYEEKFGAGNWRIVWRIGNIYVDRLGVYSLCEDAYFRFLEQHPPILEQLISEGCDVYDDNPSNVNSGLDYTMQETNMTHLQDIAIRRSVVRMGLWFKGPKLIQIRSDSLVHPLSKVLSPGYVPFHRPDLIFDPPLTGWWMPNTIECFYQSNKFLQRRVVGSPQM